MVMLLLILSLATTVAAQDNPRRDARADL